MRPRSSTPSRLRRVAVVRLRPRILAAAGFRARARRLVAFPRFVRARVALPRFLVLRLVPFLLCVLIGRLRNSVPVRFMMEPLDPC